MGKIKFQQSWLNNRQWLKQHKQSIHFAVCTACNVDLDIGAGVCQVINHENRKKHKESLLKMAGQTTFKVSESRLMLESAKTVKPLSTEDEILNAEIIRCLDVIDSNVSFNSVENDNEKYPRMFHDSDIAKGYN